MKSGEGSLSEKTEDGLEGIVLRAGSRSLKM